ncbi:hypothetical protein B2G71_17990 [Novosphingobium sp. PC22D]|uniref:DUF1206 domain-containing protein n=1 Tax=Novosphingobium sp. PC22D TaxID=1962403 RepID=UPI000BF09A4D|nr:DUF1206 domain-containing protein [Novosphingobium sp. PC22D]PEQ11182.1 hypothetical protein B2G71_17990 [Novosphingobium sp. PC22D]
MVDKSEKVVWLARLGFVARGVVYVLLGYFALSSTGASRAQDGPSGAFEWIQHVPGGTVILFVAAIGLLGYALFRFSCALFDTERHGTDVKGIGHRIAFFCSGLIHVFLAWTAAQFAYGAKRQADDSTQDMANTVLTIDFGSVALGIAGLALLVAGFMQGKDALTAKFMNRVSVRAPQATCWIGRIGYGARGVVFLVMGWSLLRSAWFERSSEVLSLGSALTDLRDMGLLYTLVALGLLMFGVFSVIVARYRVIPDPTPKGHPSHA